MPIEIVNGAIDYEVEVHHKCMIPDAPLEQHSPRRPDADKNGNRGHSGGQTGGHAHTHGGAEAALRNAKKQREEEKKSGNRHHHTFYEPYQVRRATLPADQIAYLTNQHPPQSKERTAIRFLPPLPYLPFLTALLMPAHCPLPTLSTAHCPLSTVHRPWVTWAL
jgi:hypothetical protein